MCRLLVLTGILLLLASCAPAHSRTMAQPRAEMPVQVQAVGTNLARQPACAGRFVARSLGVTSGARMREIYTYASNGAGLAAGDLDADGDLDLVFANVDRESTILWNEGGLAFTPMPLDDSYTRAVNVVDVNGDSWLDIVFTHRGVAGVSYWRNRGDVPRDRRFVPEALAGVTHYAYAMAWDDLNGDGALDLVTGAYDVELKSHAVPQHAIEQRGGVVLYEQYNGRFVAQQLARRSEALAIALVDLNGDGWRDIWAAHDFALPDAHWLRSGAAWEQVRPFRQTSHSTMSIDWGDIDNTGRLALLSTDMNPGDLSPAVLAEWLPVISTLEEKHGPDDPQIMANVLQVPLGDGWRNEAAQRGIDATGWSWSGKLGDLDNDGFLDLYVVNGMIALNLFGHLAGGELVEENRAFRNDRSGRFRLAPAWGLGSTASGRGLLLVDLDNDGDLDVVVHNMRSPAQLFENQLCRGAALEVDLFWPSSGNTRAIGAQLELHTSRGILRRDVRSASGYLSGDPARVHFGFPEDTELQRLVIRFPDGGVATVDALAPQTLLEVTRP